MASTVVQLLPVRVLTAQLARKRPPIICRPLDSIRRASTSVLPVVCRIVPTSRTGLSNNLRSNLCRNQIMTNSKFSSNALSQSRTWSKYTNFLKWANTGLGIIAGASGLVGICFGFLQLYNSGKVSKLSAVYALDDRSRASQFNFIADVVEKASPAVVYIEIKGRVNFHGGVTTVSNGSGFVVREDGLILTNAHVVANKQVVIVKLQDGRSFEGRVQAVDPVSDLATVKINCHGLVTIPLGNSSRLRPGEWVVAMGSPLSLSNTVTAGIVSTVHRESQELGLHNRDMGYIQTDAVINFGNSGGPLVNLNGEAIGINTMKVATGISFAIPSDYARDFLEKAEKLQKRVSSRSSSLTIPAHDRRRYIGITMLTLNPAILMELRQRMRDFPNVDHGVLIHKIAIGSPADSCGLEPMDVIVGINNRDVASSADVYREINTSETLKLTVRRGHDTLVLNVRPEQVD